MKPFQTDTGMIQSLQEHGIHPRGAVYWNLPGATLYEHALNMGLGSLSHKGALVVDTTPYTGRSPRDRFVVWEPETQERIWWGDINYPFPSDAFNALYSRVTDYLGRQSLYLQDLYAGADPHDRVAVRIITESPWHAQFARNMFILPHDREAAQKTVHFSPDFSVVHAPKFHADPNRDRTRSEAFIILSLKRRVILIGGTRYGGEIKKSIFTVMNYLLPMKSILTMHASASVGTDGNSAILFGLSGTGKTTLSTDPTRKMIGDDEIAWGENGIFNIEGGCYAKIIRLDPKDEPLIFGAVNGFEAIMENAVLNPDTRAPEWDNGSKTENTRASYPLTHLPNAFPGSMARHPKNIVFLSEDCFGVLPPVSRLTATQAMYHFINGYTSKASGTERGITEPKVTFSPCFGAPFLPLRPSRYAQLFGQKIETHNPSVWMINTGWSGGPYGVGRRIPIGLTRAILNAALSGNLDHVLYTREPFFALRIPGEVPGLPGEMLHPRDAWADPQSYDVQATKVANMFRENFKRYGSSLGDDIPEPGHAREELLRDDD